MKIEHVEVPQVGTIIVKGLSIDVRILDRKTAFNKRRYLVTPVSGTGEIWVDIVYSVKNEPKKEG